MNDPAYDTLWISVPLSGDTVRRLKKLADMCHADPKAVAASLLHDVLADDEGAHPLEVMPVLGRA